MIFKINYFILHIKGNSSNEDFILKSKFGSTVFLIKAKANIVYKIIILFVKYKLFFNKKKTFL